MSRSESSAVERGATGSRTRRNGTLGASGSKRGHPALRSAWIRWTSVLAGIVVAGSVTMAVTPQIVGAAPAATLVSTGTSECGSGCGHATLQSGDSLSVTFNAVPAVASSFQLTLTDGVNEGTVSSSDASAGVASDSATFTMTSAPLMSVGTNLNLANLEIIDEAGITDQGSGSAWNLVVSGEADKVVPASPPATCTAIADRNRVFGGTNCSIGFGSAGPTPPQIYDIIAVPAWDLAGPPQDSAPEVVTNCGASATDTVYDLASGATLGSAPCGTNLPGEGTPGLGNTTDISLDYIPTPSLTTFEQVGVIETIPGSTLYVSATAVPPQLTGINVSGQDATFNYNTPVVCETTPPPALTLAQFTYTGPWWETVTENGLVYPGDHGGSVVCPSSTGATSITVNFGVTIPSGVRFRFDGNGSPNAILGAPAPNSPFAGESEASQTAYVGSSTTPPDPSISSFTGPAAPIPSSGGPTTVDFTVADATMCALSAGPSAGVGLSMPYRTSIVNPPSSPEAPCPDSSGSASVTLPANTSSAPESYLITLTASSLPGTNSVARTATLVVPAPGSSPPPPPPVTPAAGSSPSPGSMVLFSADGANGRVWNAYDPSASANGPAISGNPSAVVTNFTHVYASGPNGDLLEYVNDGANGRAWNAYDVSVAAGGGPTLASNPAAFLYGPSGLIHVYLRTTNGDLIEYVNDGASGHLWNAYDLSAGPGGDGPIVGSPVEIDLGVQVHVYAKAANGDLVEYTNDGANGHLWNAYDLSFTPGGAGPVVGTPGAVNYGTTVHVYVTGATGDLLEYVNDGLGGHIWNAYDLSAGPGGAGPISGTPSAVTIGIRVHVYAQAPNGDLLEYVNDGLRGHVWNAYDLSAGPGGGGPIAGMPVAIAFGTTVHVYARVSNNDLVEYVNDGQRGHVWNAYDLTVASAGPRIAGDPGAVISGGQVEVFTAAA